MMHSKWKGFSFVLSSLPFNARMPGRSKVYTLIKSSAIYTRFNLKVNKSIIIAMAPVCFFLYISLSSCCTEDITYLQLFREGGRGTLTIARFSKAVSHIMRNIRAAME